MLFCHPVSGLSASTEISKFSCFFFQFRRVSTTYHQIFCITYRRIPAFFSNIFGNVIFIWKKQERECCARQDNAPSRYDQSWVLQFWVCHTPRLPVSWYISGTKYFLIFLKHFSRNSWLTVTAQSRAESWISSWLVSNNKSLGSSNIQRINFIISKIKI